MPSNLINLHLGAHNYIFKPTMSKQKALLMPKRALKRFHHFSSFRIYSRMRRSNHQSMYFIYIYIYIGRSIDRSVNPSIDRSVYPPIDPSIDRSLSFSAKMWKDQKIGLCGSLEFENNWAQGKVNKWSKLMYLALGNSI